ncbi:hypothetical protein H2248_000740 [Termitomyces sp. 'cryptogamus']|nr:hypothetical protein H2248_000740 [Termitomyces sp. 'cryptogamus']
MTPPSVTTDSVPSSSPLWATASKEWVIAPKPKPGRKPKKDVSNAVKAQSDTTDAKGRRIQNRAAQRAFRERKQSQLAELQARVQSYEQGEIERNVALQNIAKRLKEENDILRTENALLKEKLVKSGLTLAIRLENDQKRPRDDSPVLNPGLKRIKTVEDSPRPPPTLSFTPSPPSTASSPNSSDSSDNRCSPLPSYETQSDTIQTPQLLQFPSMKPTQADGNGFPPFDCGFCTEDTPCMCRELVQQVHAQNNYGQSNLASNIQTTNPIQFIPGPPSPPECILENLPPYQPAVPLRRRPGTSNVNSVFAVTSQAPPVTCTGDPSNCMACADDAFGKAFCLAIEESVTSQAPCTDCPCNQTVSLSGLHRDCNPSNNSYRSLSSDYTPSASTSTIEAGPETMPTNDAWRQIKAHPNVSFADLALLAEVVARRSKCTGPKVVILPALGSVTPERTASPASSTINLPADHESVLLTDPHAHFREKERVRSSGPSSSPRLAPQDVLIRCGRQGVREVPTDAVRTALRLLDAKFT